MIYERGEREVEMGRRGFFLEFFWFLFIFFYIRLSEAGSEARRGKNSGVCEET